MSKLARDVFKENPESIKEFQEMLLSRKDDFKTIQQVAMWAKISVFNQELNKFCTKYDCQLDPKSFKDYSAKLMSTEAVSKMMESNDMEEMMKAIQKELTPSN